MKNDEKKFAEFDSTTFPYTESGDEEIIQMSPSIFITKDIIIDLLDEKFDFSENVLQFFKVVF